jgi:hypothetical protein
VSDGLYRAYVYPDVFGSQFWLLGVGDGILVLQQLYQERCDVCTLECNWMRYPEVSIALHEMGNDG